MNAIDRLLMLARLYAAAQNLDLSTVSWRALGDTKKLAALESGRDIQVKRCDAAIRWFADHWPIGTAWPQDVERPSPSLAPMTPSETEEARS